MPWQSVPGFMVIAGAFTLTGLGLSFVERVAYGRVSFLLWLMTSLLFPFHCYYVYVSSSDLYFHSFILINWELLYNMNYTFISIFWHHHYLFTNQLLTFSNFILSFINRIAVFKLMNLHFKWIEEIKE